MLVISFKKPVRLDFTSMKIDQSAVADSAVLLQAMNLGERLARLLTEEDPSVKAQSLRERQRRVNRPSPKNPDELDFQDQLLTGRIWE